jgi:putative effector of murein hydrolase
MNELAGAFASLGLALDGLVTAILAPIIVAMWR